jgi:hypothetical protein
LFGCDVIGLGATHPNEGKKQDGIGVFEAIHCGLFFQDASPGKSSDRVNRFERLLVTSEVRIVLSIGCHSLVEFGVFGHSLETL